ncbi:uncharacterized protein Tco025E_01396 [Trypanosoma conorhini]|uniref:Uncharacterized protein n=1 Tax=Trypanosoma conorhini TaxID=83891 RepID=A0A3R7PJJ6_9TRYP|nr:uncharacterized protein Tco025E_01396 [Trypanosoma conorhini]RNF26273.1 hypothetical protein Tco025E_01396 [Trypanosoma conorhini]
MGGGKADVAPVPPPLRGMMLFVTQTLAEALALASGARDASVSGARGAQRQARPPPLCPSEERLFKAFQHEFASCQGKPHHSLLRPPPQGHSGAAPAVCLQRQSNASALERGCYLLDLDHVYTAPATLFTEAHQWWKDNTRELRMRKKTSILRRPVLLMIVLSPPETAAPREPGNMFPSLVLASADTVKGGEEELLARVCGFPPDATFGVSLSRLRELASDDTTKSLATEGREWNWLITHHQSRGVSCDWCNATLISSDFLTHSIFFLEWCVPEDFAWSPGPTPAEGWGSDVLGKLLRGISEQLFPAGGADSGELPSKRHRAENNEAFLDLVPTARLEIGSSTQLLEEAKREVDVRFVEASRGAVSLPPHERVVRNLLGQLNMIEEVYFSSSPPVCGVSVVKAADADPPPLPAAPTGRVAQLLRRWEEMHGGRGGRPLSSPDLLRHQARSGGPAVGVSREDAGTPFLELLQKRCMSGGPQSSAPFLLTWDGERLLEAPRVAETTLREPPEGMVELADVAELLATLNASSAEHLSRVTAGECGLGCQLPRGPLKDILEDSVAAYISSAAVTAPSVVGDVACAHDVAEPSRERDDGRLSPPPTALLEALGDVVLNFAYGVGGGADAHDSPIHDALRDMLAHVSHIAPNAPASAGSGRPSSPIRGSGESNTAVHAACLAPTAALRGMGAAQTAVKHAAAGLTEVDAKSRGVRWLRHLAFLFAHAAAPAAATGPIPLPAPKELPSIEVEQARRVVRGLEAHLFFLDAALCAVDGAIARRWEDVHEALEKGST